MAATAADVPANAFDYVHATTMTYDPVTGFLLTSTTEPGIPSVCSVKTDAPDPYGNTATVATSNCTGAAGRALFPTRTVTTTFAAVPTQNILVGGAAKSVAIAAGVALTSSKDPLGQLTTYQVDPRFGTTIQVTAPGSRVTSTDLDDFGRVVKVTAPDNTSSVQGFCLLTPAGTLDSTQASNSPGCAGYASLLTSTLVPPRSQMVSFQQDYAVDGTRNGPLKFTFHDPRGRVTRVASESFDGSTQGASYAGAWTASDTVYDAYGNAVMRTSPFYLSNGSTRTTGSFDVEVSSTQYDVLGRPRVTYSSSSADASTTQTFGSGGSFGYGSYGTRRAAVLREDYAGLKVTETNDKGAQRITEKKTILTVARVTDANGAQVAFQYDGFGNLLKTTDALQNSLNTTFNLIGKSVSGYDPDRGLTVLCLDAIGQVKAKQTSAMRGGDTAENCPDNADNGTSATLVSKWTTYAYDALGRVAEEYGAESRNHFYYGKYADGVTYCDSQVSSLCESTMTAGLNIKRTYDTLGRQVGERKDVVGDSITFTKAVTFDPNTASLSTVTYPTGVQVKYAYTPTRGFLTGLTLVNAATINPLPDATGAKAAPQTLAAGSSLWQVNIESADGNYEQTTLGSGTGVVVNNTYAPNTGRPSTITAGPPGSPRQVVDYAVTWDSVGNVATRLDNLGSGTGAVSESFGYDGINRLSSYAVQGPDLAGYERTVQLGYNALGMLLSKSDVGNYSYLAQGGRHPHALQTLAGATSTAYSYDPDGNVLTATAGKYATLTYTSEDRVATAANADKSIRYNWLYDEGNARVRETRTTSTNTRKTWYDNAADGLFFESEYDSDLGGTTNRHFLTVGGITVGVLQTSGALPSLQAGQFATVPGSVTFNKFEYWYRDNLGSLIATSDHLKNATAHYSYDPFGLRRFTGGVYDAGRTLVVDWDATHNSGTARGFTGHEQLDDIGLVNMNGRLYDAGIALVIQADSHLADPYNLQNYSSYAYVLNNPLNATDPTGFDSDGSGAEASAGASGSMVGGGGLSDQQQIDAGIIQTPLQLIRQVVGAFGWGKDAAKNEVKSQAIAAADGYKDIRANGSRTNFSTGWVAGHTTHIVVNGALGLAMTGSDLMRVANPTDTMNYMACPQCMPPMYTPLGSGLRHLQTGELSPVDAAHNVTSAIAGVPGRIKEDYRTGGNQEVASQLLALGITWYATPTRLAQVTNIAGRGGSLVSESAAATAPVVETAAEAVQKMMDPRNLRSRQGPNEMSGSKIERYKKDMKKAGGYGDFPPIEAADVDGQHIIIDGHHRAAAAARAKVPQVPVIVRKPVDAAEASQLAREAAEAISHRF